MKRLIQYLLGTLLVIFVAYFFLIDYALKIAIERGGSKALQAQLDISSVTFHIIPTSLTLNGVQATNPRDPLRNIIEAERIAAAFNLGDVFKRKLIINEAQLQGLRFNRMRAHSGAIAGLTPSADNSALTTPTTLPDSNQLSAEQQQRIRNELNRARQELTTLRDNWRQHLQQLPDDNRINTYRQRALAAKNNGAALEQLRRDIRAELSGASKLEEEFSLDVQRAQTQLGYANTLPSATALNNFGGARGDAGNIVGALLSNEFAPLLQQVLTLAIAQPQEVIANGENDAAQPWLLLIRKIALDGQIDFGESALHFVGAIDNVTPQPQFWNVATTFALRNAPAQPGQFSATGTIDFRSYTAHASATQTIRFNLSEFPLQQWPLSTNPQFSITIAKAVGDFQGLLSLTGNQIDFNLLSRFQQASLRVQTGDNPAAALLADKLRAVTAFDLNFQVSGNVQKPKVRLDSSLNQILADALAQQLQGSTNNALNARLQQELAPEIAALRQLSADFDNLRQEFSAKQAALQSIGVL